ncbi:hypothetical protein [Shewanella morhuae]|uniref:Uncharacterized protein n=1 Tax=Shewanella morhuae TaxID=365591 RepID=A0A380BWZ8_9GAMM|nr:hypothetical protein [Shewanella morhuae]SUJ08579.1 Uncharacterised protein [Shewanella morhuae]
MDIGKRYFAIMPASSFEGLDGEVVFFEEKRLKIEVLPKPQINTTVENLPEHFKGKDWYAVKNLITGNRHWLHSKNYQISEICSSEL